MYAFDQAPGADPPKKDPHASAKVLGAILHDHLILATLSALDASIPALLVDDFYLNHLGSYANNREVATAQQILLHSTGENRVSFSL
jgi:hypothetical protein